MPCRALLGFIEVDKILKRCVNYIASNEVFRDPNTFKKYKIPYWALQDYF